MYTYNRKVTYSEIGADGQTDGCQIARYFQDCSTFQSEDLGVGLEYLFEHGKAWLLSAWQIVIERGAHFQEELVTATWPYDFDAMYGYRNYVLKDKNGEALAYANSRWVLVDINKAKPLRLTEEDKEGYVCEERYPMEYAPRKIRLPKEWEEKDSFFVTKADLDTNHHVNNARYIGMALEYVPEGCFVHQIRVEYKKAAVYKDMVCPKVHKDGDLMVVALCDSEGHAYAVVEFITK